MEKKIKIWLVIPIFENEEIIHGIFVCCFFSFKMVDGKGYQDDKLEQAEMGVLSLKKKENDVEVINKTSQVFDKPEYLEEFKNLFRDVVDFCNHEDLDVDLFDAVADNKDVFILDDKIELGL